MIKVDQGLCISCGSCVSICPQTFVFNSAGKSEAISQEISDCAHQAMDICPVGAISID